MQFVKPAKMHANCCGRRKFETVGVGPNSTIECDMDIWNTHQQHRSTLSIRGTKHTGAEHDSKVQIRLKL